MKNQAQYTCQTCGKVFIRYKSPRGTTNIKFCSNKCHFAAQVKPPYVCKHCGKTFRPRHRKKTTAFCSRDCLYAVIAMPLRTCKQCGKTFKPKRTERIVFCSLECSQEYIKHNAKHKERTPTKECLYCGKEFQPQMKTRAYCSVNCAEAHLKELTTKTTRENKNYAIKQVFIKTCQICGQEFKTNHSNSRCCSSKCKSRYATLVRPRYKKEISLPCIDCVCEQCGHKFVAIGKRRKYCSKRCACKVTGDKRRAQKHGVFISPVKRIEIFERDHWVCQICGEPVNPALLFPDSMSASLDHIIPFAVGGAHVMNNVQLAHFICNSKKSDRI
jgi:hypothetical protein